MKVYVWTVVVLFGLDILGKAYMLYSGDAHRTPATIGMDLAVAAGLMGWGFYILGGA